MRPVFDVRPSNKAKFVRVLVISAIILRFVGAAATPVGPDFVKILAGFVTSEALDAKNGPIGFASWMLVLAWRALPIAHPDIMEALTAPTFRWSGELLVLVILVKLPLVLIDLASALLVYKIVLEQNSAGAAQYALLLCLFNPYSLFAIEMWGSPEILGICLTLLAIWFHARGRKITGSVAFGAAIATRLFPVIFSVAFICDDLRRRAWKGFATQTLIVIAGVVGYFAWSSRISGDLLSSLSTYSPHAFVFDEFTLSTSTITIGLGTVAVAVTWFLLLQFWDWRALSVIPASMSISVAFLAFYNWHPAMLLWPMMFVLLIDYTGLRDRGALLFLTGSFFVLLSNIDAILNAKGLFFIPTAETFPSTAIQATKEILSNQTAQLLAPVGRALFTAVAIITWARIQTHNGATFRRITAELRGDRV